MTDYLLQETGDKILQETGDYILLEGQLMAFPTGWTKRHKITIDHTKVGGSANLSDFPVLLTEANFYSTVFDNTQSAGQDLRFTSDEAGTTELAFEIVTWDTTNDKAEIYVKIPTLSYTADTVIYVWYGNDSATAYAETDTYGKHNAWRSEYKAVYHLNETSGTRYDSTGNSNDLADNATVTYAAGKVGNAASFELDNSEYLSITDASQTGLDITSNLSVTQMIKPATIGIVQHLSSKYDLNALRAYRTYLDANNKLNVNWSGDGTVTDTQITNSAIFSDTNSFAHIGYTLSAATPTCIIYKNGSVEASTYGGANVTSILNSSAPFALGTRFSSGTAGGFFDGLQDESRVYAGILTAGWIATEYANLNAPSTFATKSDETNIVPSTTVIKDLISMGIIAFPR